MMNFLFIFLGVSVAVCSFALLTNLYREHRRALIQLKPNCLLTRNPVVFITGPRSLFYFRRYWNFYPEILAEHGYPVFTLHLPWRGKERIHRFHTFVMNSPSTTQKFHFICDTFTAHELKNVFDQFSTRASVIILQTPSSARASRESQDLRRGPGPCSSSSAWSCLSLAYRLHRWHCLSLALPSPQDLGLTTPSATPWLLEKVREKAEQDFLS